MFLPHKGPGDYKCLKTVFDPYIQISEDTQEIQKYQNHETQPSSVKTKE